MKSSDGRAARLFLCMIGAMLILIGGVFCWLMLRSYQQASESRAWPQSEALILRSVISERAIAGSPREYRLSVLFGYVYKGKEYTSEKISPRGAKWSRKIEPVTALAEEYKAGSTHTAWVNPEKPDAAILEHDTKAAGYTIWFPAVIIIGGMGMIWGAFKSPAQQKLAPTP